MPTGDQAIEEGGEAMVVEDLDPTVRRQAGRQQLRPESEDVAIPVGIHRWVKYKLSFRVRGYEPQDRSLTGVTGRCLGHGCQATAQRAEHPRTAPSCCTRVANPRTPDDAIRGRIMLPTGPRGGAGSSRCVGAPRDRQAGADGTQGVWAEAPSDG